MSFGKYVIIIKKPFGRLVRVGTSLCHKVEFMEVHMYGHIVRYVVYVVNVVYQSMRKEDTYFWRVPKCSIFKSSSAKLSESLELFPRRSGGIVDSISACIGI